ncbi:cupin domain-containing protein [Mucilaginibacter sp. 14171R-50]|uniref:cupin domain-containing protein n=1 Tax=Mucilaginibacter sp. 14171R-50 TaxID=2703789 RepID=UPI00138D70D1|nr:cupin domain-containing protein [Mucilaginibacter sp. 14171R-50]QHS55006.1 cupin domain-containing protein [Mucilaginibacter sp. 14171R-50]
MRRKKFIASLLATASIPVLGNAFERTNLARTGKAFIANAGEGRIHGHIKLKGVNQNIIDVKVSGSDTDGQLAIFEQTSLSQGKGTPLHVHHSQDEIFQVLEGEYQFKVGEDQFRLKAGDSIFLPMKVPHAWTQASARGKMTVTLQPAGKLENFFVSVAALDHEPSHAEMAKLFADNEMQVVGPPLKLE